MASHWPASPSSSFSQDNRQWFHSASVIQRSLQGLLHSLQMFPGQRELVWSKRRNKGSAMVGLWAFQNLTSRKLTSHCTTAACRSSCGDWPFGVMWPQVPETGSVWMLRRQARITETFLMVIIFSFGILFASQKNILLTMSFVFCTLMIWHLGPCWPWRDCLPQG